MASFSDPQVVARYTDGPPRFVPGACSEAELVAVWAEATVVQARKAPSAARAIQRIWLIFISFM